MVGFLTDAGHFFAFGWFALTKLTT